MRFRAYPNYKDSGVEWLRSIPAHWNLTRFRRVIVQFDQGWSPNANNYPASVNEFGVLKLGAASKGIFYPEENKSLDEIPEGVTVITPMSGDILISRANTPDLVGDVCVVEDDYPRLIIPDLIYRLKLNAFVQQKFICWFLLSWPGRSQIGGDARGSNGSMVKLSQGHVRAWIVPLPHLSEQNWISDFLNRQTNKLDKLISKKRELIDRLKEKRTALISHTVTRGLPPSAARTAALTENPALKPSGVEWIGEIPAHWEVTCLKYVTSRIIDCPHETPAYNPDGEYLVIRTADLDVGILQLREAYRVDKDEYYRRIRRERVKEGDILYSREGERWGMAALVPEAPVMCLGQRMMQFRASGDHCGRFLMWQLNSNSVYEQGATDTIGSTSPHVNVDTIRNYHLTAPPLLEQIVIASYLDKETAKIDALISKVETAIERLLEYRAALITAAVTGKIDVRECAA